MDNIKGFMKMVKAPEGTHGGTKAQTEGGANLKTVKKTLEEKMNRKLKSMALSAWKSMTSPKKTVLRFRKSRHIWRKWMS